MQVTNSQIACFPISTTIEKEQHTGFVTAKQKTQLISTVVVFGDKKDYWPGTTVYLRGECISAPWARLVYTVGNEKFILVPISDVVMLEDKG